MHGIYDQLQSRINNCPCLFGVESFNQRGRALEIGKQSGERFAFTIRTSSRFHCGLLSPDTLGQVGRRITGRRLGAGHRHLSPGRRERLSEGSPALAAELGGGPHLAAATGAGPYKLGPTFLAELQPLGILEPTARAAHAASLLLRAPQGKEKALLVLFDKCSAPAR